MINNIPQNSNVAAQTKTALPEQKLDEVVLSKQTEDEQKKKYKKWGIATSIATGLTAVGLIIRGRLKAVTKLAEHIDFTPAKTMEEAVEFAKTHLKIKKFDTANDLDIANWVNEGLVNINNKYKGKAHIPSEVRSVPPELKEHYKNVTASMESIKEKGFRFRGRLTVNVDVFNKAHKKIDKMLKVFNFKRTPIEGTNNFNVEMKILPFFNVDKQLDIMQKSCGFVTNKASKMDIVSLRKSLGDYYAYSHVLSDNPMAVLKDVYSQKGVIENLKKYMPEGSFKTLDELKTMANKEQIDYVYKAGGVLQENILLNEMPSARILDSKRSVFDTLYHEEGHLFHYKNTILKYNGMHVVYNQKTDKPEKIGEIAKEFLDNKEEQFIASTVSSYAKSSPLEFVADVYARMLNGHKFGDDVMKLYEKYQGMKLPA